MSAIKPVTAERFDMGYSFYGQPEMQSSETGDYVEFAAYEALQKENAELKAEMHMARDSNEISSLANKKFIEESAAQAKRIAELEAKKPKRHALTAKELSDPEYMESYLEAMHDDFDECVKYQGELKAEIESLRKQVEELSVTTGMQHRDIVSLKSALSIYGDPDVLADDED